MQHSGFTRWALVAAIAALLAVPQARAEDAPRVTVRMAVSRAYNSLMLARARGEMERNLAAQGISIKWVGPFAAMAPQMEALTAGEVDFGSGSSSALASAVLARVPATVFGYTIEKPGFEGIIVTETSSLKSVHDLIGKKVAVNRGGSGEYLLLKALEYTAIPVDKVTRVYMGPADSGSALQLGNVDAWATWDPFISIAEDKFAAKLIVPADTIGSENAIVMVVRTAFLQGHPEVTREVFHQLRMSDDWAVAHPEEAGALYASDAKMPASLGRLLASHASNPLLAVGAQQRGELKHLAAWMYDHRIIPALPDLDPNIVDFSNPQ